MKKYLPVLSMVGAYALSLVAPDVQTFVVNHPSVATGLGVLAIVVQSILPPVQSK